VASHRIDNLTRYNTLRRAKFRRADPPRPLECSNGTS